MMDFGFELEITKWRIDISDGGSIAHDWSISANIWDVDFKLAKHICSRDLSELIAIIIIVVWENDEYVWVK